MTAQQWKRWTWVALIVLIDCVWTFANWTWAFITAETNVLAWASQKAWHIAHWPTDWILRSRLPPYRGDLGFYTPEGGVTSDVWMYGACIAQTAVIAYVVFVMLIPFAVRLIQRGQSTRNAL
jgi:hypothetical protein